MDLLEIIGTERRYTFHSHTQYCDGRATVDEMARAAVEAGFRFYGFSPHSPIPIESPCNMSKDDVDAYKADVEAVRARYSNSGCRFFIGMEVDYLGPQWGPSHPYFTSLGLDYTIGSVHFIPSQEGVYVDIDGRFENFKRKMSEFFHNDVEYVVDTFYRQSEDMIRAGGFDILGHFDKVGQNAGYYAPGIEDSEFYRRRVDALIDLIADRKVLIELNTKAYREHGRFFPSARYLSALLDRGVRIVVNSDAHRTDAIDASRDEGFRLLDNR